MRSSRPKAPVHEEISNLLREEILGGEYQPKVPLPTELQLRQRFGASRFTVRQALDTLVVEGLIYRRPGSGTFVTGLSRHKPYVRALGSVEDVLALGDETYFRPEHPLRREISKPAAERLGLEEEEVHVLRGTRHASEEPFGYWQIYLPPDVGALLGEGFTGRGYPSIIGKIEEETDARLLRAEQAISADLADAKVARALRIEAGSPVLTIERLYLNEKDDPLEFSVSMYRPDQYRYRIDLFSRSTF